MSDKRVSIVVSKGIIRVRAIGYNGWVDWPIWFEGVAYYDAPERIPQFVKNKVNTVFRFLERYQGAPL
jgi:hypothetical protein